MRHFKLLLGYKCLDGLNGKMTHTKTSRHIMDHEIVVMNYNTL